MAKSLAPLKLVTDEPAPKKRIRKAREPKRESAADIAARLRKGKGPAQHRIFSETVKGEGDLVISSVGAMPSARATHEPSHVSLSRPSVSVAIAGENE